LGWPARGMLRVAHLTVAVDRLATWALAPSIVSRSWWVAFGVGERILRLAAKHP
jgi:hypothetical protein